MHDGERMIRESMCETRQREERADVRKELT